MYKEEINELNKKVSDGKIPMYRRTIERENMIVDNLLRYYTIDVRLVEFDGRNMV